MKRFEEVVQVQDEYARLTGNSGPLVASLGWLASFLTGLGEREKALSCLEAAQAILKPIAEQSESALSVLIAMNEARLKILQDLGR